MTVIVEEEEEVVVGGGAAEEERGGGRSAVVGRHGVSIAMSTAAPVPLASSFRPSSVVWVGMAHEEEASTTLPPPPPLPRVSFQRAEVSSQEG